MDERKEEREVSTEEEVEEGEAADLLRVTKLRDELVEKGLALLIVPRSSPSVGTLLGKNPTSPLPAPPALHALLHVNPSVQPLHRLVPFLPAPLQALLPLLRLLLLHLLEVLLESVLPLLKRLQRFVHRLRDRFLHDLLPSPRRVDLEIPQHLLEGVLGFGVRREGDDGDGGEGGSGRRRESGGGRAGGEAGRRTETDHGAGVSGERGTGGVRVLHPVGGRASRETRTRRRRDGGTAAGENISLDRGSGEKEGSCLLVSSDDICEEKRKGRVSQENNEKVEG